MPQKQLHFTNHQDRRNHVLAIAKELEIDVKNIKLFKGHDGKTGINASIYQKNKKFATAYDDARGGEMDIDSIYNNPISKVVLKTIINALLEKPKYKVTFTEDINGTPIHGEPISYKTRVDLPEIVDTIAHDKEVQRIFNRQKKRGILFIDTDGEEKWYRWKWPLAQFITKYPKEGLEIIQNTTNKLKKEGAVIQNLEYLQTLGVKI
ncbi:MAG: hypothetical protein ACW98K_00060 [Candidatus Kariarchaeaceae archaeon]|jgi:hypothetical protein